MQHPQGFLQQTRGAALEQFNQAKAVFKACVEKVRWRGSAERTLHATRLLPKQQSSTRLATVYSSGFATHHLTVSPLTPFQMYRSLDNVPQEPSNESYRKALEMCDKAPEYYDEIQAQIQQVGAVLYRLHCTHCLQ